VSDTRDLSTDRSGDTLVVAAFGGDTTTGLYRVARQAYDNLAGLTDAVHQFYTPTIVDALARGRTDAYRRHRRRLMAIGTVAAVVSVLASWLLLRPIAAAGWPQYLPALPAFDIFAALLVATLGVHGWLWPAVVSAGRVGQFGILALSGAAAQVAAIAVLGATGGLSPASAAATAWLAALINYGPLLAAG
ncbi:MAG TPA: hypothetical protein PK264_11300, partial [Hyphomicrobiaceae bacterium]|nr:hypothetical protein [Hyphomicrobiaceae bacterium]